MALQLSRASARCKCPDESHEAFTRTEGAVSANFGGQQHRNQTAWSVYNEWYSQGGGTGKCIHIIIMVYFVIPAVLFSFQRLFTLSSTLSTSLSPSFPLLGQIRECLDQGLEFPSTLDPHSMAEALVRFLENLSEPVYPAVICLQYSYVSGGKIRLVT